MMKVYLVKPALHQVERGLAFLYLDQSAMRMWSPALFDRTLWQAKQEVQYR